MDKRKQSQTDSSYEDAKKFWDSLSDNPQTEIEPVSEQVKKEFHRKLIARIAAQEQKKEKRKIIRYSSLLVAATLVLIGSIVSYRSLFLPDVYQARDSDLMITLKDGSKVTLSKDAILTIEKSFPADTRDVFLEGNATFNVSKSKIHPFIVHAGSYETKVLGTVFKITQDKTNFKVDLYEGRVQVIKTEKPTETFVIHPKETFSNLGSKDVATIVDTKSINGSKIDNSATVSFTDIELFNAIKILEDTYNVKIQFPPSVANSKISASKEKATAPDLIRMISLKLNLKTKKIDDKTFQLEK
ncbi:MULTISPECIES: FecR family protein [Bacteroidota]|uniref:FecR family protein n=1 Tax=Bacteroidota TaxID=976 RepID=UPI00289E0C85|nr:MULTISPECIES: FecR family protein [Bacteroidota]